MGGDIKNMGAVLQPRLDGQGARTLSDVRQEFEDTQQRQQREEALRPKGLAEETSGMIGEVTLDVGLQRLMDAFPGATVVDPNQGALNLFK